MTDAVMYVDEKGNPVNLGGGPNYPPIGSTKSDKADLLDKIKPDLIVEVIRHKLMGEEFINNQWVKIQSLQDRAISELGAWELSNLMLSASSQNIALSKLKDHEIRDRTLSIVKTAQHMAIRNWIEYGITGSDQLEFIHEVIMTNTFITLKQPEGGGIRSLIKDTTNENRQVVTQESPGGFAFWRRRGK